MIRALAIAVKLTMVAAVSLTAAYNLSAAAQAKDIAKGADHPLVGRYDGSSISFYETKAYEERALPVKAAKTEGWQKQLSGKLTSIRYEGPGERSVLEVIRNYEAALTAKGMEILFFCSGKSQCAPKQPMADFWNVARGGIGMPSTWDTSSYLVAQRNAPEGNVTVAILGVETKPHANKPMTPHVAVTVIEEKPLETDKIKVIEASEMEQTLARDGKIAIYGIYFDFDKSEIKPESKPQIEQLGALLKDNPKLDVVIVGHTDSLGKFDYNLTLSQRRAQSVVDALTSSFGVARERMTPAGAGMVSPVASNRSEAGREKNRRVEIVERYSQKD